MSEFAIATIKDARYGLYDFPDGRPGLWFIVEWSGYGAVMSFQNERAEKFLIDNQIYAVDNLNGQQCVVDVQGPGAYPVLFVRLLANPKRSEQVSNITDEELREAIRRLGSSELKVNQYGNELTTDNFVFVILSNAVEELIALRQHKADAQREEPLDVHVHVHLDTREITQSVTRYQADELRRSGTLWLSRREQPPLEGN